MKLKLLLCLLMSFFISETVFGADSLDSMYFYRNESIPKTYLGVSFSSISSAGISLHRLLGSEDIPKVAIKFTIFPIFDDYNNENSLPLMIGGELQRNLYTASHLRVYGLIGIGYTGSTLLYGCAVGYELFKRGPGLAFNLDLGLTRYEEFASYGYKNGYTLGIGIGLSYVFAK